MFAGEEHLRENKIAMKPRLITTILFIIGLGLFAYSLTLPYYKDQKSAHSLISNSYNIARAEYYKKDAELRTNKVTFMDLGLGLTISSVSILLFLLGYNIRSLEDFKKVRTPNKTQIFISANIVG